jgi:hypothetical protein
LERLVFQILAAHGTDETDVEEYERNGPQSNDQIFGLWPLASHIGDSAGGNILTEPQLKVLLGGERSAVEFGNELPANEIPPPSRAAVPQIGCGDMYGRFSLLKLPEQLLGKFGASQ